MAEPIAAVGAAVAAGLLGVQLLREAKDAKQAPASAAPTVVVSPAAPQLTPGPVDQGGPAVVYALPPGVTPKDIADFYASQGRPHDAAPVINLYQIGVPPPGTPPPNGGGGSTTAPTPDPTPLPPPRLPDGTTPPGPAPSTPGPSPETHEDLWGRKQPGPPSSAETSAKALLGYGGSAVLAEVGSASMAANLAKGRSGLGGAAAAGAGLGLYGVQVMQDTGFFDHVVKPAGASFSEKVGPTASKAVATALVVPAVTGGAIKALVTPGESVIGNARTAISKTALPDAFGAVNAGVANAKAKAGAVGAKVGQAAAPVTSFFGRWFR